MKFAGFKCDYCDRPKGEGNHWFLLWTGLVKRDMDGAFHLVPWDDVKAQTRDHEHICSEACAVKALAKWMGEQKPLALRQVATITSLEGDVEWKRQAE